MKRMEEATWVTDSSCLKLHIIAWWTPTLEGHTKIATLHPPSLPSSHILNTSVIPQNSSCDNKIGPQQYQCSMSGNVEWIISQLILENTDHIYFGKKNLLWCQPTQLHGKHHPDFQSIHATLMPCSQLQSGPCKVYQQHQQTSPNITPFSSAAVEKKSFPHSFS